MCNLNDLAGRQLRQGNRRLNYVYAGGTFVAKFASPELAEAYVAAHNGTQAESQVAKAFEDAIQSDEDAVRERRNARARERYAARKAAARASA